MFCTECLRCKLLLKCCLWHGSGAVYLMVCIITSAKEVNVFAGFCLSVCVCVYKITQKVMDGSF